MIQIFNFFRPFKGWSGPTNSSCTFSSFIGFVRSFKISRVMVKVDGPKEKKRFFLRRIFLGLGLKEEVKF
jgi:hypothetical protein